MGRTFQALGIVRILRTLLEISFKPPKCPLQKMFSIITVELGGDQEFNVLHTNVHCSR